MAKTSKQEEPEGEEADSDEGADSDEEDSSSRRKIKPKLVVSLYEPMFVWTFLLTVAVVLQLILSNTPFITAGSKVYLFASTYSGFILNFPGTVVLPLIIGAVIGSDVGRKSSNLNLAAKSGILNGIFASLVYVITIIVIYLVINYATSQYVSAYTILSQDIVVPILVFLVTLEIFAVLSHLRRVA